MLSMIIRIAIVAITCVAGYFGWKITDRFNSLENGHTKLLSNQVQMMKNQSRIMEAVKLNFEMTNMTYEKVGDNSQKLDKIIKLLTTENISLH